MRTLLPNVGTLLILIPAFMAIRAAPTATNQPQFDEQQQKQHQFANLTMTCTARECEQQLNRQHLRTILSNMKPSADPCLDFHEYACGNWRNLHTNGTTSMKLTEEKMMQKYIDLFERWLQDEENEVIANQHKLLNVVQEKMLKYYKVCRSLDSLGRLSLKDYLREMTKEANLWQLQSFDWLKTLAELGRFGYSSHFVKFTIHDRNATFMQLKLVPHEDYNNMSWSAEIGAALDEYASKERGEALHALLKEFERKLLSQLWDEENVKDNGSYDDDDDDDDVGDKDKDEKELTLAELNAETAHLNMDWQQYVSKILGRDLELTHKLCVADMGRIKKIASFLQQQEPETLMLYTMARFLNYLQELKPNFLDAATPASSYNCLKHMRKIHFVAMNYIYELEYYSKERSSSDALISKVFNSLKEEFKLILQANAMNLSSTQLDQLLLKLSSMRLNIGNLPINVTPTFYNDYVHNLNVNAHNFYHNHLHALQHYYGHKHLMLDKQDQQLSSPMLTFSLNDPDYPDMIDISPIYTFNMIVIPFAYLDLPFYSVQFWDMLLYGDLANTLGHELIHGFDQNFLPYDANTAYSKLLKDILQNSNFKKNRACLDVDTEFLAERIADVSGIHLAIRAFMQNAALKHHEWRLFFMQFAQFFCGSTDLASFRAEDPYHDMDNLRLNYVLAQTPEFAQIYECPLGSPMHPATRCHMW